MHVAFSGCSKLAPDASVSGLAAVQNGLQVAPAIDPSVQLGEGGAEGSTAVVVLAGAAAKLIEGLLTVGNGRACVAGLTNSWGVQVVWGGTSWCRAVSKMVALKG